MKNCGTVTLEEGWGFLEEKIIRARQMVVMGLSSRELFTNDDFMYSYHYVYCLCTQPPPHDYSRELYERFTCICEDTVLSVVLPLLTTKDGITLLAELVRIWPDFKLMVKFLSGVFMYLEGHYIPTKHLPSLTMVSINCFSCQISGLLFCKIQNAVISMINQERAGKQVDQELLKSVLIFLVEIGETPINHYEDLEKTILADAATFYSRLSSELRNYSHDEYIKKVQHLLAQESQRASQYLSQPSVDKLLQVVQWALLRQPAGTLAEEQKLEGRDLTAYQDLLTKCASIRLEEGNPASSSPHEHPKWI